MGVIQSRIHDEVSEWEGVEAHDHRMGGVEFVVGRIEIGHLHGDRLADLPFPKKVRDELIAEGRAEPHHVLPESGWVSRWIESESEVDEVIALFRLNYDRIAARRAKSS
jgi:Family of unknown function (DUF5519)